MSIHNLNTFSGYISRFLEYYEAKDIDFNLSLHNEIHQAKKVDCLMHPDWNLNVSDHMIETRTIHGIEVPFSFININIKRQISSYVFHTFMPSFVLSVASTLSVFIHYDNMPARMSLVTSSCLSLITLYSGAKNSWPNTSYLTAMIVWTLYTYVHCFASLVEYCIVLALIKTPYVSIFRKNSYFCVKYKLFCLTSFHIVQLF